MLSLRMDSPRRFVAIGAVLAALLGPASTRADKTAAAAPASDGSGATEPEKTDKSAAKRAKIDQQAAEALEKLLAASPKAKAISEKAFGYAVFDARKTSFAVAGGSGRGVAVESGSGARTYMKMASVGFNFGAGIKFYQVIFFFEDEASFRRFVDKGWEAGAGTNAVGGTESANLAASFVNGMAIFEQSDKGLMLSADLSGTKYWQPKSLNEL